MFTAGGRESPGKTDRQTNPAGHPSFPSQPKLVADLHGQIPVEINFEKFFTLNGSSLLIGQLGHDFSAPNLNDIPSRGIGVPAINPERHPPRLIAQSNLTDEFGWHDCRIKNMQLAIGGIREPKLLIVGRKTDAVTGTTMTFLGSGFAARHLDSMQKLAGAQITDLKAEQPIHINETQRLASVHSKRANHVAERIDREGHLVRFGIHYG